jgi:NAD(P)-dependent dehydrogenase (short-subunit alcohol dehydrogenase family)
LFTNMMRGTLIITGASRGIGAAIARMAAGRPHAYSIAVNYLRDERAAHSVVQQIRASGGTASAIQADVGSEPDVLRLFDTATRELGPVTGLVNNAGIADRLCRVEDLTALELERMFRVNVIGTMLCSREAVRRMSHADAPNKKSGIVNISSLAARIGGAGEWVHYAASKAAVNTFTIGLAREVASQNIRVNAVAAGLVNTEFHANVGAPDRLTRLAPMIPMQRSGRPDEIAEAVLWLLSSAASYVTGSILEVGGGR